ncbi:MAG: glycerol-3-phosphate 1-O-acyltransferase PlsY [Bacillota bacterium]|jgi:glycerol-3-phosphate acyltransferase PlsY|nr:glycerol-3-phosphate 1-O-acyltransferase PlsY [Bacillota bacterium]
MVIVVLYVVLSVVIGYLLGSINASVVIGKTFYGKDIREYGSGNAGATNTLRTFGKPAAAAVFIVDFLKGIAACFIGQLLVGYIDNLGWAGIYLAGFAAVIGHNWPVFFGFRGGKGVLTSFAVILYISPVPALICLTVFIVIVVLTRYVSLGSIIGAIVWPVVSLFFKLPALLIAIAVLMSFLIVLRHKGNIKRLFDGTEKKLSFKNKK